MHAHVHVHVHVHVPDGYDVAGGKAHMLEALLPNEAMTKAAQGFDVRLSSPSPNTANSLVLSSHCSPFLTRL